MQETGTRLTDDPNRRVAIGIALIAALRSVGSAVPTRLALDALAVRLDGDLAASSTTLFPTMISSALHPIYSGE
jgi:hypothetical protein